MTQLSQGLLLRCWQLACQSLLWQLQVHAVNNHHASWPFLAAFVVPRGQHFHKAATNNESCQKQHQKQYQQSVQTRTPQPLTLYNGPLTTPCRFQSMAHEHIAMHRSMECPHAEMSVRHQNADRNLPGTAH